MSESTADLIQRNTDEMVARLKELTPVLEGTSADDNHQFIVGFVHVLEQAARGNMGPRTQYLQGVIPAIKAGGMPATVVMAGMVRVSMGVASFFGTNEEAVRWAVEFCADYTTELTQAYSS